MKTAWQKKLEETKKKLDKISPSMCLAKWLQVTIHLQNGHNHSCHHNPTHRIDAEAIQTDPSMMHNTALKLLERQSMLNGERPPGCFYCWRVEDSSNDTFSDRIIKSSDEWADESFDKVSQMPWDGRIAPAYLEVSFSNLCNFACAYCKPEISSKIFKEIKEKGPYPVKDNDTIENLALQNKLPYKGEDDNPYIQAFWKWFESISSEIKVFRLTGGEPLIHKNTFKLFQYLLDNPNPNMEFSVNSNFGIDADRFDRFISESKKMLEQNAVKKILTYTSVDTHEAQAEYGRDGLNYQILKDYCRKYLMADPRFELTIMVTFNVFSVPRFKNFLEDVLQLRKELAEELKSDPYRFIVDISNLHSPEHLNVLLLPGEYASYMQESLQYMQQNQHSADIPFGFHDYEINKMSRIIEWFNNSKFVEDRIDQIRADFFRFVTEFDTRRKKDFLGTFPEYESLYRECQNLAETSSVEQL